MIRKAKQRNERILSAYEEKSKAVDNEWSMFDPFGSHKMDGMKKSCRSINAVYYLSTHASPEVDRSWINSCSWKERKRIC